MFLCDLTLPYSLALWRLNKNIIKQNIFFSSLLALFVHSGQNDLERRMKHAGRKIKQRIVLYTQVVQRKYRILPGGFNILLQWAQKKFRCHLILPSPF